MILKKYISLDIGKALLYSDIILAVASIWDYNVPNNNWSIIEEFAEFIGNREDVWKLLVATAYN